MSTDSQRQTNRPPGLHEAIQTDQYCEVADGIRLHFASCGTRGRPLVLLVHGFPEFWYAWRNVLPMLGAQADYFAVAPDLRGYNLSSKPPEVADYKARLLVQDLIALAKSLGYEKFFLVGHDWGGAITWTMAQTHPASIERLVILNSPHPVPFARALAHDEPQQKASAYMNWLRRPGSEDELLANDLAMMDQFLTKGLDADGQHPWYQGDVKKAYHAAWSQPGALRSAINYYRVSPLYPPIGDDPGARRLTLAPEDFQIRVPTLVIWGERDTALLPVVIEGLDACVPDLRIERLANATHWLVHEQPDTVARLIKDFIKDAPGSAG